MNKYLLLSTWLLVCPLAYAKDYSAYPCNIFSSHFCFRMTTGVGVEMSMPADYTIYKLIHQEETFATFYVGNHPEEMTGGGELKKFKSGSLTASFSNKTQGSGEVVGFSFLFYDKDDMPFAHLKISSNEAHKDELFSLVSSIRPCAPLKKGGQMCEINKDI